LIQINLKPKEDPIKQELNGKVAMITGAGRFRGIGRSTAVYLAKSGASVAVLDLYKELPVKAPDEIKIGWNGITSLAKEISQLGKSAIAIECDVTNKKSVNNAVQQILEKYGKIDILINNAAYPNGPDRVEMSKLKLEIFQKVMAVKVTGSFLCSQAVSKSMIQEKTGGKIITIASGSGKKGFPKNHPYTAACFAQVGMTQSLAKELGPYGINVNCICPGPLHTARVDHSLSEIEWEQVWQKLPLQKPGHESYIASFVSFLCSESASWITGQAINIDGGSISEH